MKLWSQLPRDAVERAVLVAGAAFKMTSSYGQGRDKRRCFYLLNVNPLNDQTLLLVTPQREIMKRQRARAQYPQVLVYLKPGDHEYVTAPCVVDCMSVERCPTAEIIDMAIAERLDYYHPLGQLLLAQMRFAALQSPSLNAKEKKLLT